MDDGSPGTFRLGIGMAEVGTSAVKVAKNRGDTQPPGDMSADQTLRAATRPRQFSGGAIAATRLFLGLLLGPLGMAGLAGLGCPGGLTFQVEPGATVQECDGYWANSRQRPASANNARQLAKQNRCPLPLPPLIIVHSLSLSLAL